jgi:hypothetical protein
MFCVSVLARVPVAVYWMVVPDAIVLSAGVTIMDKRSELVRVVESEMPLYDALMVVVPAVDKTALTSPPAATVAIAVLLEAHVTDDVRFCLAPFEKVPSAVNWMVVPGAMLGEIGLIAMDTRTGGGGLPCSFTLQAIKNRRLTINAAITVRLLFFISSFPFCPVCYGPHPYKIIVSCSVTVFNQIPGIIEEVIPIVLRAYY